MAYFPDINAALDLVATGLRGVDLEAAINTADLTPPGAWVRLSPSNPFPLDVLSGESFVGVEVVCVVGAMPLADAYDALTALAEEVVELYGHPDGPVRTQATVFGNDPVPLPSLVLPYHVAVSKEGTPVP